MIADRVVLAFYVRLMMKELGWRYTNSYAFSSSTGSSENGNLPLAKKLNEGAEKVFAQLSKKYNCEFDDRGNIGKRYRRQDEIGTPFCITYDFDSEEDHAVTVRDRDTMEQVRIPIAELDQYFADKFTFRVDQRQTSPNWQCQFGDICL